MALGSDLKRSLEPRGLEPRDRTTKTQSQLDGGLTPLAGAYVICILKSEKGQGKGTPQPRHPPPHSTPPPSPAPRRRLAVADAMRRGAAGLACGLAPLVVDGRDDGAA